MADAMASSQGRVRTGVVLRDPIPWHDLVLVAQTAEQTGYDACFVPEITGREAFATLAGLAGATSTLRLGTGVVPLTARRLMTTAMGAATVQEISGSRLVLGVGAGAPGPGALDRVRSQVTALRSLLAGHAARSEEGEVRLALEPQDAPPIWIAALGPRITRLAGAVADGVLLNWCTPDRVRRAREEIARGAGDAGRDPTTITIAVYVRACLGHEESVALAALRAATAQYAAMPHYRRQLESLGLGEESRQAAEAGSDLDAVPESLVRALCLLGDPAMATRRLQEFRDAGADLPLVYPVPVLDPASSLMGTLLALAPSPSLEP